jgi:hypothetical protein
MAGNCTTGSGSMDSAAGGTIAAALTGCGRADGVRWAATGACVLAAGAGARGADGAAVT